MHKDVHQLTEWIAHVKAPNSPGFIYWTIFDRESRSSYANKSFIYVVNLN